MADPSGRMTWKDLIALCVAAVRAASGEYTGAAAEAIRHSRRIAAGIIGVITGFLILFTILAAGLSQLIPGLEALYKITNL